VTIADTLGIAFFILFLLLVVAFLTLRRKRSAFILRTIPAFKRLSRAFGMSVEAGKRIHISLGRGNIYSEQSSAGFLGLSVLERINRVGAISDRPPVASCGDPTVAILSQDTLKSVYRKMVTPRQASFSSSRLTGLTPFSYAAGVLPIIYDEHSSIDILLGNFNNEVALIADASERNGNVSLAGSDNLIAQSIMYAAAREPLIGEEFFASGAYIQSGPMHIASLYAQDVIRWILIASILVGAVLRLLGLV
jgi:hypothetical protein